MSIRLVFLPLALIGAAAALSACTPVGTAVGVAAGVGVAAAQERSLRDAVDDTKIRAEINHLWFQSDIEMYRQVGLTITEGRVLLTGEVPTQEARVEAVRLAWQADGVREVINEIQVGDQAGAVSFGRDSLIANTLRSRLLLDKDVNNINYTVQVVNGVVYVMGIAQNQDERDRVIGHARNIEYVENVVSHVVLKDDPSRAKPQQ